MLNVFREKLRKIIPENYHENSGPRSRTRRSGRDNNAPVPGTICITMFSRENKGTVDKAPGNTQGGGSGGGEGEMVEKRKGGKKE